MLLYLVQFEEEVCVRLRESLSEQLEGHGVREEDWLSLVCLACYVLLLGRCCRGWGEEERRKREAEGATPPPQPPRAVRDPLQQYKRNGGPLQQAVVIPAPDASSPQRSRRARMGGRLDLGSFLVGVEVSLRQTNSRHTRGLFGPLSYGELTFSSVDPATDLPCRTDVGVRVNLSSSETFLDLVVAVGKTLQSVRHHHHFPFSTVTDEVC